MVKHDFLSWIYFYKFVIIKNTWQERIKKIKVKVIYENKPCSYEECVILYKQLFVEILKADKFKTRETVERVVREAFSPEIFKEIID